MKRVGKRALQKIYAKHMQLASISGISHKKVLKICEELSDVSYYLNKEAGLSKAASFLEALPIKQLTKEDRGRRYYCLGNIFSDLGRIRSRKIRNKWQNEDLEKAIFYYRKSLTCVLTKKIKTQVLINLANLYDKLGRFIKSLKLYEAALKENSVQVMAHGNKGLTLCNYSFILSDKCHRKYFLYFANKELKKALSRKPYDSNSNSTFNEYYEWTKNQINAEIPINKLGLYRFSIKRFGEERNYQKWCLSNRLFLNPLNDLGDYPISSHDVLHLPSMTLKINQNHIEFPSFYNQLKQEYVSARYLFYEGIHNTGRTHFSDRGVLLIDPLDYPRYSLNIEKIKMSFIAAYSLFDKISLFLRRYLRLRFKSKRDNDLDFKKIWYENGDPSKKKLNTKFRQCKNRALQGLFLISKDLLYHRVWKVDETESQELKKSLDPSAKEINSLRNHLEHGYVKIHESFYDPSNGGKFRDKLAYSVSEKMLIQYTLKVLELSREALIYLSLAVHIEERRRNGSHQNNNLLQVSSDTYEDDWKF